MRPTPLLFLLAGCGGAPFGVALTEPYDAQAIQAAGDERQTSDTDVEHDRLLASDATPDGLRDSSAPWPDSARLVDQGAPPGTALDSGIGVSDVDACALVTHDNGFGRTWQDCNPPDAATACGSGCTLTDGYGGVCNGAGTSTCTCWDPDGHVRAGSWPMGNTCNAMTLATPNLWH